LRSSAFKFGLISTSAKTVLTSVVGEVQLYVLDTS